MNKVQAGKALSAAAIANLAVAGFVAAPANAAVHPASAPQVRETGAQQNVVPGAGRAHSGLVFTSGARDAVITTNKPRGFVPRGVKPFTDTTCNGHTCLGVFGHGLYVSKINIHFFGEPGAHSGTISWSSLWHGGSTRTGVPLVSMQHASYSQFDHTFAFKQYVCASFSGVPGAPCVYLD
jgi:hypothetical protein